MQFWAGAFTVTWREVKSRWVSQHVRRRVNLGAQAPSAASDGLVLRCPPFTPERCWRARTMVESTITYSLSGSCDSAVTAV